MVHAEQGHSYLLGMKYVDGLGGVIPPDWVEAEKWLRKAAEQAHHNARSALGVMYSNGQGVPQDYAEALKWFRRAAEQGDPSAQFNVGVMYRHGQGVPQDYVRAHKDRAARRLRMLMQLSQAGR